MMMCMREWHHGERHGKGKHRFANGDFYGGEWTDGKMTGNGTAVFADGDVYEGGWKTSRERENDLCL
jgi:hypothetical protein